MKNVTILLYKTNAIILLCVMRTSFIRICREYYFFVLVEESPILEKLICFTLQNLWRLRVIPFSMKALTLSNWFVLCYETYELCRRFHFPFFLVYLGIPERNCGQSLAAGTANWYISKQFCQIFFSIYLFNFIMYLLVKCFKCLLGGYMESAQIKII